MIHPRIGTRVPIISMMIFQVKTPLGISPLISTLERKIDDPFVRFVGGVWGGPPFARRRNDIAGARV